MFVREPRPLTSLDTKEYPLAQKPTPPELANFTFDVDEHGALSWSTDSDLGQEVCLPSYQFTLHCPVSGY